MPSRLGSKNKVQGLARDSVWAVWVRLGGSENMTRWAKNNETEFYKMFGRMVTTEGPGKQGEHTVTTKIEWVIVDPANSPR